MATRRLSVSLPVPVLDVLYAEGSRTYESPGEVAARILREALPKYIERRLTEDLAPVIRGRVINVQGLHADVATPPAIARGVTRPISPTSPRRAYRRIGSR
jgi:hypothetical protein